MIINHHWILQSDWLILSLKISFSNIIFWISSTSYKPDRWFNTTFSRLESSSLCRQGVILNQLKWHLSILFSISPLFFVLVILLMLTCITWMMTFISSSFCFLKSKPKNTFGDIRCTQIKKLYLKHLSSLFEIIHHPSSIWYLYFINSQVSCPGLNSNLIFLIKKLN